MWCCDTLIDSLSVKGPVHLDLSVLIPPQRPDVLIVSHLCVMDGVLSKCGQQAWTTGNCVTIYASPGMENFQGICRITDKESSLESHLNPFNHI